MLSISDKELTSICIGPVADKSERYCRSEPTKLHPSALPNAPADAPEGESARRRIL